MRITHIDHFKISLRYGGSEAAILHLAVVFPDDSAGISPDKATGQFDHISLKARSIP